MVARTVVGVGTLLLLTNCSIGKGTGSGYLLWDLGTAPQSEISSRVTYVLQMRQYQILRQTESPHIYIETQWEDRIPFDDEVAEGYDAVRTRFLIEARERTQRAGGASLYSIQLRVENIGRLSEESDFRPIEATPQFREYANEIAEEIRSRLGDGIRVF